MITTEETMAIAVLKGDLVAARGLADCLVENAGLAPLYPTRVIQDVRNLRVVVYFDATLEGVIIDTDGTRQAIDDWLANPNSHLLLAGAERIELYEFPPQPEVTPDEIRGNSPAVPGAIPPGG